MPDIKTQVSINELAHQPKFRAELRKLNPDDFPGTITELPPDQRKHATATQALKKSLETQIASSLGITGEKMTVGLLLNDKVHGAIHDSPTRLKGYIKNARGEPVAGLQITLGERIQVFVDGFDLTGKPEAVKAYVQATKQKDYVYSGRVDFNSDTRNTFFGAKGNDYVLLQGESVTGDSGGSIQTLGVKVLCASGKCAVTHNQKQVTYVFDSTKDKDKEKNSPLNFGDVRVRFSDKPSQETGYQKVLTVSLGGKPIVGFSNTESMRIERHIRPR